MQIEDPDIGTTPSEALGAIYGFIAPSEAVGRKAAEWQTYDITLVGRLLTVVLNGQTIISLQNIPRPTGGALDSNGCAGADHAAGRQPGRVPQHRVDVGALVLGIFLVLVLGGALRLRVGYERPVGPPRERYR